VHQHLLYKSGWALGFVGRFLLFGPAEPGLKNKTRPTTGGVPVPAASPERRRHHREQSYEKGRLSADWRTGGVGGPDSESIGIPDQLHLIW
jgi:hypothetical protein